MRSATASASSQLAAKPPTGIATPNLVRICLLRYRRRAVIEIGRRAAIDGGTVFFQVGELEPLRYDARLARPDGAAVADRVFRCCQSNGNLSLVLRISGRVSRFRTQQSATRPGQPSVGSHSRCG